MTKYIARIVAGYQADDALMIRAAIDDAHAAGYSTEQLLIVLAGALAGLLADQGMGIEDSRSLLAALAEAEEADHA